MHKQLLQPFFLLLRTMCRLAVLYLSIVALETPPVHAEPAHPLLNTIWDVQARSAISQQELVAKIMAADVTIIGETHGNPDHHARQVFLINALSEKGKNAALVLEMLDSTHTQTADDFIKSSPEDATNLGAALNWRASGWPDFTLYKPVFEAAMRARWPIIGGDIPAQEQQDIRAGKSPINITASQTNSWNATLQTAHCNTLTPEALAPLAKLQIARDQSMARAAQINSPALIIAGRAHARKDRSIPAHITGKTTLSVAFIELKDSKNPQEYLKLPNETSLTTPLFDYIWFTPKRLETSTCEKLKAKGLVR